MKRFVLVIGVLSVLTACLNRPVEVPSSIPFVEQILANRESEAFKSLSAVPERMSEGVVAVIDREERALAIGEALLVSDRFDNIDGAPAPDLLPDFAGEDLYLYMDRTSETETSLAAARDVFRVLTGRKVTDPFVPEAQEPLARAKVIILGSAAMAGEALDASRLLLDEAGTGVRIVSPTEAMFRQVLADSTDAVLGVLASPENVASGVYRRVFERETARWSSSPAKCFPMAAPDSIPDRLRSFLTAYIAAGHREKLTALLVDDPFVPIDSLHTSLVDIMLNYNEENAIFRSVLDEHFEIIDGVDAAVREAYLLLREKSWFTHRISAPRPSLYMIQDAAIVEYNEKSGTEETDAMIWACAPELYQIYVQN